MVHLRLFSAADGGIVRIISESRLVQFWESRKDDSEIAKRDLSAWRKVVRLAEWDNFGALRQTFGSADRVGNCTVFDVGNNRFRLIGRVNYAKEIVYILKIMDHEEYDWTPWANSCGCHNPPPKYPSSSKGPRKVGTRKRKGGKRS